ncbi:MAG: protein kinase [Planctomycetes bacterium]|nr:protein kinase [Planctomycetota bacterium]
MAACLPLDEIHRFADGVPLTAEAQSHFKDCDACSAAWRDACSANLLIGRLKKTGAANSDFDGALRPGVRIAGYEVLREIRRGGQGIVYEARETPGGRRVALKTLIPEGDVSPRQLRRFEREIEIVSELRHPNIVNLYQSGVADDGSLYFAMEFIDGVPLDVHWQRQRLARGPLKTSEIVGQFITICLALQHAHQKGVIHRDLKPSNILIDPSGDPHILDFGLAKEIAPESRGGRDRLTQSGDFAGSYIYAAPEQFRGEPGELDVRTDIYALGMILYELITGRLPFPTDVAIASIIHNIITKDPEAPSAIQAGGGTRGNQRPRADSGMFEPVSRDLDAIVLTMLAKSRENRYQSVGGLIDDLKHYLAGEPIAASQNSRWHLLRRAAKRHPVLSTATATVVVGAIAILSFYAETKRVAAAELRRDLYFSNLERGRVEVLAGRVPQAEDLLWRAHLSPPPEFEAVGALGGAELSGPERTHWALSELYASHPCLRSTQIPPGGPVNFQYCDETNQIGICVFDGRFQLRRYSDGALEWELRDAMYRCCAFAKNRVVFCGDRNGVVHILNTAEHKEIGTLDGCKSAIEQIEISGDDRFVIATEMSSQLHIWDWRERKASFVLNEIPGPNLRFDVSRAVGEFKQDRIAIGSSNARPKLYQLSANGELTDGRDLPIPSADTDTQRLLFTPDGSMVLVHVGATENKIYMCPTNEHSSLRRLSLTKFNSFALSHSGNSIMQTSEAPSAIHTTTLVVPSKAALNSGESLLLGHRNVINKLVPGPDGTFLASDKSGALKIWEVENPRHIQLVSPANARKRETIHVIDVERKGRRIISSGTKDGILSYWNLDESPEPRSVKASESYIYAAALDPNDPSRFATSERNSGTIKMWDFSEKKEKILWERSAHERTISYLAFRPDGKMLASAGDSDRSIKLWTSSGDPIATKSLHDERVSALAWSPDGRFVASTSVDRTIIIWPVDGNAPPRRLRGHTGRIYCIDWSGDGSTLVTGAGDDDEGLRLWSAADGECLATVKSTGGRVFAVRFSPDGGLFAAGDAAGYIQIWNTRTREQLARFLVHEGAVFSMRWSGDGKYIYSSGEDNLVNKLDLTYYDRHIAGNLLYQETLLGLSDAHTSSLDRTREWVKRQLNR